MFMTINSNKSAGLRHGVTALIVVPMSTYPSISITVPIVVKQFIVSRVAYRVARGTPHKYPNPPLLQLGHSSGLSFRPPQQQLQSETRVIRVFSTRPTSTIINPGNSGLFVEPIGAKYCPAETI
jgi:hypothetical protein